MTDREKVGPTRTTTSWPKIEKSALSLIRFKKLTIISK